MRVQAKNNQPCVLFIDELSSKKSIILPLLENLPPGILVIGCEHPKHPLEDKREVFQEIIECPCPSIEDRKILVHRMFESGAFDHMWWARKIFLTTAFCGRACEPTGRCGQENTWSPLLLSRLQFEPTSPYTTCDSDCCVDHAIISDDSGGNRRNKYMLISDEFLIE